MPTSLLRAQVGHSGRLWHFLKVDGPLGPIAGYSLVSVTSVSTRAAAMRPSAVGDLWVAIGEQNHSSHETLRLKNCKRRFGLARE